MLPLKQSVNPNHVLVQMAELQRFNPLTKTLGQFAKYLGAELDEKFTDIEINGISSNAQEVSAGDVFIALPGQKSHGGAFSQIAVGRGARAVITDNAGAEISSQQHIAIPVLVVPNPRSQSGFLADWFFGSPSRSMYVAGITGTNGKTTTTYLLHQIWSFAQHENGVIGTVGITLGEEFHPTARTTPEADVLHKVLSVMNERHLRNVAMEASSHALAQHRLDGVHFSAAGFTNLTQDHLDFHGDMESYYQAKRALFNAEMSDFAFINIDNEYGQRLAQELTIPTSTLSLKNSKATWHYSAIQSERQGHQVAVRGEGGVLIEGRINLAGDFNLENCLLAIAIAFHSGVDPLVIGQSLEVLSGAPGRLEKIECGQSFTALVDYAHTPDAVSQVLQAIRKTSTGKIIGVLGCGGDRDKGKRPLMGKALVDNSDIAIFTSDNPRSEDPLQILQEMTKGIPIADPNKLLIDRADAIEYAVSQAGPDDVVVVLGKGHESGQEIAGVINSFSDQLVLRNAINKASDVKR